jgi:hypothetical protein
LAIYVVLVHRKKINERAKEFVKLEHFNNWIDSTEDEETENKSPEKNKLDKGNSVSLFNSELSAVNCLSNIGLLTPESLHKKNKKNNGSNCSINVIHSSPLLNQQQSSLNSKKVSMSASTSSGLYKSQLKSSNISNSPCSINSDNRKQSTSGISVTRKRKSVDSDSDDDERESPMKKLTVQDKMNSLQNYVDTHKKGKKSTELFEHGINDDTFSDESDNYRKEINQETNNYLNSSDTILNNSLTCGQNVEHVNITSQSQLLTKIFVSFF